MMKAKPNSISFAQVIRFVDCPYCKAERGVMCVNRKTDTHQETPHLSRGVKALRLMREKASGATPPGERDKS
jgi:hypothetical protein